MQSKLYYKDNYLMEFKTIVKNYTQEEASKLEYRSKKKLDGIIRKESNI